MFGARPVAIVDRRKAAPSPCKCRVRPRDYLQGKRRKETGLAGKRADSAHPKGTAPAGQSPGTPLHAGIRAKKKGLETIQALGIGGAGGNCPCRARSRLQARAGSGPLARSLARVRARRSRGAAHAPRNPALTVRAGRGCKSSGCTLKRKGPTPSGEPFTFDGGAGGNRTRVRKSSTTSSTCLVDCFSSRRRIGQPTSRPATSHLGFSASAK